jgi:hypothetical protein
VRIYFSSIIKKEINLFVAFCASTFNNEGGGNNGDYFQFTNRETPGRRQAI